MSKTIRKTVAVRADERAWKGLKLYVLKNNTTLINVFSKMFEEYAAQNKLRK